MNPVISPLSDKLKADYLTANSSDKLMNHSHKLLTFNQIFINIMFNKILDATLFTILFPILLIMAVLLGYYIAKYYYAR